MSTVVVVGGGVAGCAAAVAAAEAGARVLLVERERAFGGVAAQGEHRTLCGLAAIDAPRPDLLEPALTGRWLPHLAIGAPFRLGRVWLWPTAADALQDGLRRRVLGAGAELSTGAGVAGVEVVDGTVVAVRIGDRREACAALIDASGSGAAAALAGVGVEPAVQWAAHRSVLALDLADGPATRVRALAAARAVVGDAAVALTPLEPGRWQLSLDVPARTPPAVAAARAARVADALGAQLLACCVRVAERDQGRPAGTLDLATLFATAERGLCWAAWPREAHGPDGVAWTWPPRDRHGVPPAAARPSAAPRNLWCVGKAMAVTADAAAALRVTGTCLAVGAAVGALAAGTAALATA